MRATFILTGVLAIVAAAVASQVLYELFVVPSLGSVVRVPLYWWLGIGAPAIVAVLACGWFTRSWREGLVTAAGSAIVLQLSLQVAASTGHPGWHKNFAIEAPLDHWTFGLLSVFLLLSPVIMLGRVAHAALRQSQAS